MALRLKTDLGIIKLNDSIIARIILAAIGKTQGKLFLSSERGKILGVASRVSTGDLMGNFTIEETEGKYKLTFYAVIRFGAGIKNITEVVLEHIEKELKELFPEKSGIICLHIVGVKSKQIAQRDIEVKREYEATR